ncbi:ABC transporter substrate-binding protein [Zhihengliuella sp.]|uniref:ABC transporter substrate-binding protein n=1 Tax=Zhihengliuella sp. TaxID=1954483 RepID=UPI002811444D|nr:ABC transporter substrate-binding protein [Zhihengliuella sp.]
MARTSTGAGPGPTRRSVLGWGLGLGATGVAALTGCTPAAEPARPTAGPASAGPVTFRVGTPAGPASLDPAVVADAESHRVTRQLFEGLVGVDPDSGAPAPALAEAWEVSDDGLTYTFTLRDGVRFHDGTELTGDVVVHNFERWAGGEAPGDGAFVAFDTIFHHQNAAVPAVDERVEDPGTPTMGELTEAALDRIPEPPQAILDGASYYKSCTAPDRLTVVLELNAPLTGLIQALTVPGLALAAPSSTAEAPVGTGPYRFAGLDEETTVLERFADHWRAEEFPDAVDRVELRVLRDAPSRLRSLSRGDVHGYDTVTAHEMRDLVRAGQQIVQRDPFSVLYLGMNQVSGPLRSLDVRRAAAHSIQHSDAWQRLFIAGTEQARSFLPPSLGVEAPETYYGYDPTTATAFLETAGYDGEPIPFLYPLDVSRGYLPLPELVYAELSAQLTAVGFVLEPVPIRWEDGYIDAVLSGEHAGFHLLGWNGSYRDPDHFLSSLFGLSSRQFGYDSTALKTHLAAARSMPEGPERAAAYQAISDLLARDLPAQPLSFPISALAMSTAVVNYPSSPVLDEVYDRVRLDA